MPSWGSRPVETIAQPDVDDALIAAFANGDQQAFATFFYRHDASLKRYLSRMVASQASVDDICQDAWIAVLDSASGYAPGNARAWLFGIARRHAARFFRRRAGQPAHLEPLEALGAAAGWGSEHPLAEPEDVRHALEKLDEDSREVLVLRDVEGFTNDEVAQMLGLSVPAVKSRVHRARLALLALLTAEEPHA